MNLLTGFIEVESMRFDESLKILCYRRGYYRQLGSLKFWKMVDMDDGARFTLKISS